MKRHSKVAFLKARCSLNAPRGHWSLSCMHRSWLWNQSDSDSEWMNETMVVAGEGKIREANGFKRWSGWIESANWIQSWSFIFLRRTHKHEPGRVTTFLMEFHIVYRLKTCSWPTSEALLWIFLDCLYAKLWRLQANISIFNRWLKCFGQTSSTASKSWFWLNFQITINALMSVIFFSINVNFYSYKSHLYLFIHYLFYLFYYY